jgi:hypothetical protein
MRRPKPYYIDAGMSTAMIYERLEKNIIPDLKNRGGPVDLLMVVTPGKSSVVYAPIKRYCDSVAGLASQCITSSNVQNRGGNRAFAINMLMKINSKLGGVNVSLRNLPLSLKSGTVCFFIYYI